ncbi:MAG: LytTR family transcriptional regulator DNA-binding domain-containing protein [Pseudomonadota bacterium]
MALIDPFEMSLTVGLLGRLIYWVVVIGAALQLATLLHLVFLKLRPRAGAIVARLLLSAAFAISFGPFLLAFNALFYPERFETMMGLPQLLGLLFLIFAAIGIVMDAVVYQFTGKVTGEPATDPAEEHVTEPTKPEPPAPEPQKPEPRELAPPVFLERLNAKIGTKLIRLSMQDHYVEAHTADGSQLILMRMADAIEELDGLDGLRVHRSHWVAKAQVTGLKRAQGRLFLIMSDGAEVPVSRSYKAEVEQAGFEG